MSARIFPPFRRAAFLSLLVLGVFGRAAEPGATEKCSLLLADPKAPLEKTWTHRTFEGATEYKPVTVDGRDAIRAVGRNSSSGLHREVNYSLSDYPWLEWAWRVDRLQRSADIRVKAEEDFAAAIFLIFEEPGFLFRTKMILSYVWTNDRLASGATVESPHHPRTGRSIVVESGQARLGRWLQERRNVIEDYQRAFGKKPPDRVNVIALFTDNDQTGEAVEAFYGPIRALRDCG